MRGDWEGVDFSFKDEFGATLSGMMGALAEIQKKGDSMLAGIRRQREVPHSQFSFSTLRSNLSTLDNCHLQVLNQLEERAALAETRRKEEEVGPICIRIRINICKLKVYYQDGCFEILLRGTGKNLSQKQ